MIFRWFENLIDPFLPGADVQPPVNVWRFYQHFLKQAWRALAALLVVGLAAAVLDVLLFRYIGSIVDMVREAPDGRFFALHGRELIWMAVVTLLFRPVVFALHGLLVRQTIAPSLTNFVRWQNHRYVMGQSIGWFQNDFAGRIANRIMQTGGALRESTLQVIDAVWFVITYTGGAIYLFMQADKWLAVPLVLWVVAYVWLLRLFVPRIRHRSWVQSEARSKLMGRIVDGYTNIMTLKLFARFSFEQDYAREAMLEQTEKHRAATRLITLLETLITISSSLLIVVTSGLALFLWDRGAITVGDITLASTLVIRINNMAGWIMWTVTSIFENVGTVQDGIETISQPRHVLDAPEARGLAIREGAIRFENIRFHYGKEGGVIEGLDLDIRAGEKIGLVGPSGAGKSTLVNLLLRLYDLEGGRILIDGQDIALMSQESLRAQIGVVTQDTSLLHRSIRDNLLYGRPGAGEEQMVAAARQARAHDFVPTLSDNRGRTGYDAYVGERGVKLSGGQRQRIAIARVLLKDAPILVLDEATSALDSEAEAAIQEQLENLMRGKTVIAIAHRLSTIARMDRLVVMDKGRIAEMGNHAELVAAGGLYARLWDRQTGGFAEAG